MLNSLPNILQFKYVFFLKLQPMAIPLFACFILFSLLPRHFSFACRHPACFILLMYRITLSRKSQVIPHQQARHCSGALVVWSIA